MPQKKKPFICDCNNPAFRKKDGGECICIVCLGRDKNLSIVANRTCGFPDPVLHAGHVRDWETYYGDNSPVVGESLKILDAMLDAIPASSYG